MSEHAVATRSGAELRDAGMARVIASSGRWIDRVHQEFAEWARWRKAKDLSKGNCP